MAREIYSRNWDRMSFEDQKEYRNRKLSYFVRTQLYPYSEFYRKMFDDNNVSPEEIRSVEDLRKLPFTYKSDIAPTPDEPTRFAKFVLKPDDDLINRYMPRYQLAMMRANNLFKGEDYAKRSLRLKYSPVHMQFTTGRTGFPTPILYASGDVERMEEAGYRILQLAGLGTEIDYDGASFVNAMPFAPHLGFWMVSKGLDRAGILALHSGGGRILGTQRIISAVESLKASGLVGIPGYVYHVLRAAVARSADFSSLKIVVVSGERVPKGMKDKFRELLEIMGAGDCRVLGAFGFTEARKGYSECAPDGDTGYHIFPDMDYIELVDPKTGDPVDEGEDGELVYTCLEGQGTCVIRFRTGDLVRGGITYEPCPSCGRSVPRLGNDITRSGEVKGFSLTKIKGTLVDQGAFFAVLADNPGVLEWQVEIDKTGGDPYGMDEVNVYIAPTPGADEKRLGEEIESLLQVATEVKPSKVEFLPLDDIIERLKTETGIKELRIIDNRTEI